MDDMISNAMTKFKDLIKKDPIIEIDGKKYRRNGYHEVHEPVVGKIETHTLQGIVEAVKSKIEPNVEVGLHIHIFSPTRVFLESHSFGPFLQRHIIIESDAYVTNFNFGGQYSPEEFIIALNSQFIKNKVRDTLLELCSTITKETSGTVADNGVTQTMEVKNGISMRDKVKVENPFTLKPFRTFSEIEQPESDFVFRVKDNGNIACALYEADGSAWKVKAIESIKAFFKEALPDIPVIA